MDVGKFSLDAEKLDQCVVKHTRTLFHIYEKGCLYAEKITPIVSLSLTPNGSKPILSKGLISRSCSLLTFRNEKDAFYSSREAPS